MALRRQVPPGPRWSNCLFWAKWRQWTRGGYVASRQSHHSRWKRHYAWSRDLKHWWGYVPARPHRNLVALIHGFRFRGRIERETPMKTFLKDQSGVNEIEYALIILWLIGVPLMALVMLHVI